MVSSSVGTDDGLGSFVDIAFDLEHRIRPERFDDYVQLV